MLENIPKERLVVYVCGVALLPLLITLIANWAALGEVNEVQSELDWLEESALTLAREEAPNEALAAHYAGADRFYLVKHLETLALMQDEVEMLQRTLRNQGIASQDTIEKRLQFLQSENHIVLSEGSRQTYPNFQEVSEGFQKSVDVNVTDLKRILGIVEGVPLLEEEIPEGAPQILITDFRLEKKKIGPSQENLQLNLKLLKREFS